MATRKKIAKKPDGAFAMTQEKLLGTVHQVWLAGLGAASKAQSGAPKLLEELVEEGARVHARASKATEAALRSALSNAETAVRGSMDDVREKATDTLEGLEKIFQTRVHRALKQLGVPSAEEIASLSQRVDALNANIDKLTTTRGTPSKSRAHAGKRGAAHSSAAT
jgi:poly(hydroxyalkanoate) granule-associated protein